MSKSASHGAVRSLRVLHIAPPILVLFILAIPTAPSGRPCALLVDDVEVESLATYPYRNYSEIRDEMLSMQAEHPEVCRVYDIGDGWQKSQGIADRDILALKVSDNVSIQESEPEALILGLIHAREWSTSELVLNLADNLTGQYGKDPRITWLVDNRQIWIIPVVNPDGLDHSLTQDSGWRKNMRDNGDGTFGVDLNRNFAGSMNGDPEGAWGGAGTSGMTYSEIYCGPGPFSEPETQAVRDLVLAHDFKIAIDFHSYGRWVMWPWGYTNDTAPDAADLSRIGGEFASPAGYYSSQSWDMYATTGDTVDWMYGQSGIYSYCVEVGGEFHPVLASDVNQIISEMVPLGLKAIELSGDRQERHFDISHDAHGTEMYSTAGFPIEVNITADRGVNSSSPELMWRIGTGVWSSLKMTRSYGNDTYKAVIPSAWVGSEISYLVRAMDNSGLVRTAPQYAPYQVYSFTVTASAQDLPATISHHPRGDASIGDTTFVRDQGIQITAWVADPEGVNSVTLNYRLEAGSGFDSVEMTSLDGTRFIGFIPQTLDSGAVYYIEVIDAAGQMTTAPSDANERYRSWNEAPSVLDTHTPTHADSGQQVSATADVSDDYAIESVLLVVKSSRPDLVLPMNLQSGTSVNGTWNCTFVLVDPGDYTFTLVVSDGRAGSQSSSGHLSVAGEGSVLQSPYLAGALIASVLAAACVVAFVVIRARRT